MDTAGELGIGGVNGEGVGGDMVSVACNLALGVAAGNRDFGKFARMVRMEAGEIEGFCFGCGRGFFVGVSGAEVIIHSSSEESDSTMFTAPRLVMSTTIILMSETKQKK